MVKGSVVSKARNSREYYCVCVRRNYEKVFRCVSKHDTREEAQEEIERRRSFSGSFNYDNAELWIMSRTEAKKEFGKDWEFKPIGHSTKRTAHEA
jgi:hypothetical protein